MDAITVRGLDFSYGSTQVLDHVDFTVPHGRVAVLLGPNGAGKSTLLKLLLRELFLSSDDKSIWLLGVPLKQFKGWRKISYVPQRGMASYQNFPASVEEIVRADLYSGIGRFSFARKKEKELVRQSLCLVGMEDFSKRLIGRLSGGQQQRVLLARALVKKPELLLMDEPTTGMDEKSTKEFYRLLREINRTQGVTVLMVTHDRKRLEPFADDIWLLEDGRMALIKTDGEEHHHGDL